MAAKLTLIAIYNERLTERKRRREFIQQHGLLDVKPQQVEHPTTGLFLNLRILITHCWRQRDSIRRLGLLDVKPQQVQSSAMTIGSWGHARPVNR